jgi:aspartate racemase
MKTVGIVGGIGPESTVEYYRLVIAAYRERVQDGSYPSVLINSIDMTRMLALIGAGDFDGVTRYLADEVQKLANAGADFGVLASNTPHVVFEGISRQSSLPLLSIVEAAREEAKALGLRRVGLLGTRFTMGGRFYADVFRKAGIALVVPDEEAQAYVHDKYMNELVNGVIRPETRRGLLVVIDQMRKRQLIEGVILGGTELPLILRDVPDQGIPFLDTTAVHVRRIVSEMISQDNGWHPHLTPHDVTKNKK